MVSTLHGGADNHVRTTGQPCAAVIVLTKSLAAALRVRVRVFVLPGGVRVRVRVRMFVLPGSGGVRVCVCARLWFCVGVCARVGACGVAHLVARRAGLGPR